MEEKTRRLMEDALSKEPRFTETHAAGGSQQSPPESGEAGPAQVDETFRRIQVRFQDMLSSIEESVKSAQPSVDSSIEATFKTISASLQAAGLGVFGAKAARMMKEEIHKSFSVDLLLRPVLAAIAECRSEIDDMISKTARGTSRRLGQSQIRLQAKAVQMYSRIVEQEKQLEVAVAHVRKWRQRVAELEEQLEAQRTQASHMDAEISRLRETMRSMSDEVEARNETITRLEGDLAKAASQIEQQKALLAELGSAEEMMRSFERMSMELANAQGRLKEAEERVAQKDAMVQYMREEMARMEDERAAMDARLNKLNDEVIAANARAGSVAEEAKALKLEVDELKARWSLLFSVAEDEPSFQAYFLLADKKSNWLPISHLSSALGIPSVRLKLQMEKFVETGLVEIDGDRIRARNISDAARELAGSDARLVEEMKASLEETGSVTLEAFDITEPPLDEDDTEREADDK
ncbi:MAG: hypothetical protein HXY34_09215 [Candidatus Thorarchaeota archaeon]|nr:hypothetical protein [Candidatus Thorarchaeota archaeon]